MPRYVSHYFTRSTKFPVWRREPFSQVQATNLPPHVDPFYDEGVGFHWPTAQAIINRWNAMAQFGNAMRSMGYEYRLDPPEDWIES